MQRLIEGSAYLRPGAYLRIYCIQHICQLEGLQICWIWALSWTFFLGVFWKFLEQLLQRTPSNGFFYLFHLHLFNGATQADQLHERNCCLAFRLSSNCLSLEKHSKESVLWNSCSATFWEILRNKSLIKYFLCYSKSYSSKYAKKVYSVSKIFQGISRKCQEQLF